MQPLSHTYTSFHYEKVTIFIFYIIFFFFFSSRRRHTRSKRDWSSDVCSSDLESVCHSRGEYARDNDGNGFHEVHVNTMEGFWSLLRSWLRPHRGISQDNLPLYLGFFEFVHNVRRRGKALLGTLLELLLT